MTGATFGTCMAIENDESRLQCEMKDGYHLGLLACAACVIILAGKVT